MPEAQPARPEAQIAMPEAQPASKGLALLWLAGIQAWLAGIQAWLTGIQSWLDAPEGGTDGRTDIISPFYRTLSPSGKPVTISCLCATGFKIHLKKHKKPGI